MVDFGCPHRIVNFQTPTSQKLRLKYKLGFADSTITDVSMLREYNNSLIA
jgi:hypothetical protein